MTAQIKKRNLCLELRDVDEVLRRTVRSVWRILMCEGNLFNEVVKGLLKSIKDLMGSIGLFGEEEITGGLTKI